MTVAADARAAVREHPFLETALRAGVVNYTAAARFLDVGAEEAVAAALRRYAAELDDYAPTDRRATVPRATETLEVTACCYKHPVHS